MKSKNLLKKFPKNILKNNKIFYLFFTTFSTFVFIPNWIKTYIILTTDNKYVISDYFGTDLMAYVVRAKTVWDCNNLGTLAGNNSGAQDSFNTLIEPIFFKWGCYLGSNKTIFFIWLALLVFLFTLVAILSFYLLVFSLTNKRSVSILSVLSFVFINNFSEGFTFEIPKYFDLERWPVVSLNYILINFTLILILKKEINNAHLIWLVLSVSISFLLYFYSWQILGALLISAFFFELFNKNLIKVKSITLILLGVTPMLTYTLIKLLNFGTISDTKSETYFKSVNGLEFTRTPFFSKYLIVGFIFAYFASRNSLLKKLNGFYFTILFAALIISTQNIITGYLIQPGHYFWYFIKPYIILIFIVSVIYLISFRINNRKLKFLVFNLILILSLVNVYNLINNTNYAKKFPSLNELNTLPSNIYSFDNKFQYYIAINSDNNINIVSHSSSFKNAYSSFRRMCLVKIIWNGGNLGVVGFKEALNKSDDVCSQGMDGTNLIEYTDMLKELRVNNELIVWNKWISDNDILTILTDQKPKSYQLEILAASGFSFKSEGVYLKIK